MKSAIEKRVHEKIDDFQFELEILADSRSTQSTRNTARDVAKRLFINNGGVYNLTTYYNNSNQYSPNDTCIMETVSKLRPNQPKSEMVCDYLQRMSQQPWVIEIKSAGSVRVDNLNYVGQNRYQCTAHIVQSFRRYVDGKVVYRDTTLKTFTAYVDVIQFDPSDPSTKTYKIQLEDCLVDNVY